MTSRTRRLLFLLFFLIFSILVPLISLYASGYKIGAGFNIQKTGILILNSNPRSAKIYINGEIQQKIIDKFLHKENSHIITPAKIKNLLPGEYNIKIELADYWPWEKKLTVKPGESTFAEDINLFRKNLPIIALKGAYEESLLNIVKEKIVILQDNKLLVYKPNGEEKTFVLKNSNENQFKVSPGKSKVIINRELFSLENLDQENSSLNSLIGVSAEDIKWGKNDNELSYTTTNSINLFNLETKTFTTFLKSQNFTDYLIKDNHIYLIAKNNVTAELNVWDMNKNEMVKKISLPYSNYVFLNSEQKYINLYDSGNEILYLVDPLSHFKPLREIITNVNKTIWLSENKLLFANDFEIWLFDLGKSQKTLLTRISKKIEKIILHPNNNYVIYSTEKEINILELDDREKFNITKLIEFEKINNLNINEKGDELYFYAKIGNQKGIYKLSIQ